jgi:hypothetical protein
MRQKTKNYRIRGSNAKKKFFLFYFPSHIPIWVHFVQKTQSKNSHAWAPLNIIGAANSLQHVNPLLIMLYQQKTDICFFHDGDYTKKEKKIHHHGASPTPIISNHCGKTTFDGGSL